ncbi:ceramidase [Pestalotiopsis sp. NC0098]|nr:ceramidase [Pestalotiopsis sp. NC0098]
MEAPKVSPYWGEQTSYLNFCEEDYTITRYVAEFINTLSSLTYIVLGVYGLWTIRHQPKLASRSVSYFALMGVGACSAGYHMTLKYHTQMSDELSMHLLITPLIYRLLAFKASPRYTKLLGVILCTLFTTVMVTHMVLDEFLLHASTFGLGVYVIQMRISKIVGQISSPAVGRVLRKVARLGLLCFVFGYCIWLVDRYVCNSLIEVRHMVGLPWAFILELHGWWHFFTAIGGYIAVVVVDMLTLGEPLKDPAQFIASPVLFAAELLPAALQPAKKD